MIYRSCVRLAMLYGSETCSLRENEVAILRRTERAMVRPRCGVKLMEKKRAEDLMEMLVLKETVDQMAKANGVRWYRHVLRRGMMGMFWEKHWSLKWRARGNEDDQGRHGKCKWRRRAGVLVWRKRINWIKRDREWELERLLPKCDKSCHPHLQASTRIKIGIEIMLQERKIKSTPFKSTSLFFNLWAHFLPRPRKVKNIPRKQNK